MYGKLLGKKAATTLSSADAEIGSAFYAIRQLSNAIFQKKDWCALKKTHIVQAAPIHTNTHSL